MIDIAITGIKYGLIIGISSMLISKGLNLAIKLFK